VIRPGYDLAMISTLTLPVLLLFAVSTPPELVLVEDGGSAWSVVLPDEPSPSEREAAAELVRFVRQISQVELPILREAEAISGPRLLLGATRAAEAAIDFTGLGEDGFVIRAGATEAGPHLFLAGGCPEGGPQEALGTLYAVYHLLEEQFACRFWAPGALEVPQADRLVLPADLDLRQDPAVWFRHVNYGPAHDRAYRRWHKLDRIQEEVGRLWAPRWVHSAFAHLPPDRYFDAHPEYYSQIGGERRPSQLCLTNPQVLELVTESFRRTFAEHPDVRYISFSQEDNYEFCRCEDARRINEREGSEMGELLTFINALAERFPDRIISTLAYQYSRRPPRHLRPRENVSIMLCTIEEDRRRPIAADPHSTFPADFTGWSEIADDIFLWDYEVQFASPVAPFPNLRVLQPNVRWFVDHGVRHLFLQGNGRRTELAELRCYLLAKLAWNADIDVEATIDEFLVGFHGAAAAPHLRAYLDLLHDEMEAAGEPLLIYGHPALAKDSWLRPEVLEAAWGHLDRASEAVATDPLRRERLLSMRLPLMYAELEIAKRRGPRPGGIWTKAEQQWQVRGEIPALLTEFLTGCEAVGITRLREQDLTLPEYRAAWDLLLDPHLPDHRAFGAALESTPPPSAKYLDGDLSRLVDGLPGGDQYQENWIGWEGTDAVITLDLGQALPVTRLSFSALQDPKSWVWLPRAIEVEGSINGVTWFPLARLVPGRSDRDACLHRFDVDLPDQAGSETLRYFRLAVDAGETCPGWHLGAGGPAWFFLDELRVE
jgi:hypothetical protein